MISRAMKCFSTCSLVVSRLWGWLCASMSCSLARSMASVAWMDGSLSASEDAIIVWLESSRRTHCSYTLALSWTCYKFLSLPKTESKLCVRRRWFPLRWQSLRVLIEWVTIRLKLPLSCSCMSARHRSNMHLYTHIYRFSGQSRRTQSRTPSPGRPLRRTSALVRLAKHGQAGRSGRQSLYEDMLAVTSLIMPKRRKAVPSICSL